MKIEYKLDQVYKSCEVDNIQDIPNYDKITYIDCSMNQLIYLPDLPSTLTTLYCSLNWLSSLPDLPSTLTYLDCSYNKLSSLPDLPSTLTNLDCSNNQLSSLSDLPSTLQILYCSCNLLSSLHDLPSTLKELICYNNQLSYLPDLPSTLTHLDCYNNQFIKKDQYQESIINNIMGIVPWTKSKEYFLNNLIRVLETGCSKCYKMIVFKEKYIYNPTCTIKTKICQVCCIL